MIDDTFNPNIVNEFRNLLSAVEGGNRCINESTMQEFLEKHTSFIPTPFMQNHGLHFNSFIAKFPIGSRVTDFAYLTKSTVEWFVVLMELENPHKKLFKGNSDSAEFTADYTHARQQIRDWKSYIDDHKREVIDSLQRIRKPLADSKVSFKYVLVMGRRSEIENSEARKRAIAEENEAGRLEIVTYDTLLSDYERKRRLPVESLVLTLYDNNRFECKYLPTDKEHCGYDYLSTSGLFSYMSCDDIKFSCEQIKILKKDNYDMDNWLEGKYLTINEKSTEVGCAKKPPHGSRMRELFESK